MFLRVSYRCFLDVSYSNVLMKLMKTKVILKNNKIKILKGHSKKAPNEGKKDK